MEAAFLVRCSTDSQDYQRQLEDLKRVADNFGYTVKDENIFGEYITGKDDVTVRDRKSIERLRFAAEKEKFDVILVNEVHRMSRDPVSGRYYIRVFNNMEMPIYFRDERRWTVDLKTKKVDKEFEKILGSRFDGAADYLNSLKTQTASGRRTKLSNNQFINGKVLFGYTKLGGSNKYTKHTLIVDEVAKNTIINIYEMYLKDSGTLKSVSLSASAKFNKKYSVGRIYQILTNPTYHNGKITVTLKGDPTNNIPDDVYIITVDPLIDEVIYNKVQKKLSKNRSSVKPYNAKQKVHTLSRLIKCSFCGHSFTPRKRGDKRAAYNWLCMSRINNSSVCNSNINLNGDKVESIVWNLIKKEILLYAEINEEERSVKIKDEQDHITNYGYEKDTLEDNLKIIDNENKKAYQLYFDAPDTIKPVVQQEYYNTLSKNQKEIEVINNRIAILNSNIEDAKIRIENYSKTDYSEDYIKDIESDPKKKREIVVANIKEVRPYKVDYRIVVLEIVTISGTYNVLFNANQRNHKEAYYIDRVYAMWQNSIDRYKAHKQGDYFVITHPDMVMDSEELEEFLSFDEVIDVCKANDWTMKYEG